MVRQALGLGDHGEIETTAQIREGGLWVTAPNPRRAGRHRARAYYRGWDGLRGEVSATAKTKHAAIKACEISLAKRLRPPLASAQVIDLRTPFVNAGQVWLAQASRADSGLAPRSVVDYVSSFNRHLDGEGSSLRGLTLEQANDPQRLRIFLQTLADRRGTGASKMARSVISNILNFAVDGGVLTSNAMRQVRSVKSQTPREDKRDRTRAFTRAERDRIIAYADECARRPDLNPRSVRRRESAADLIGFLAGTGARIDEARSMRWQDYDAVSGTCRIRGTKSERSDRVVNAPGWLRDRLDRRAARSSREGLIFAAPALLDDDEQRWDQGNSNAAVREVLDGAGFSWAIPHTFRRTVATLLHEAGVPIVRIADQLGHSDPGMTARVYLGRDFEGDKADLAEHL